MDSDTETYILLLLSDSNLPTGAFVASAGLESYVTHGFFATASASALSSSSHARALQATTSFLRDNLSSYARAALPFVADAHEAATRVVSVGDAVNGRAMDAGLDELTALDDLYERMTLNHVARRASQSQGVALLTLHARGFSRPTLPGLTLSGSDQDRTALEAIENDTRERCAAKLVDQLKFMVRREDTPGHLPICWGVLTAALGLSTGTTSVSRQLPRVSLLMDWLQLEVSTFIYSFKPAASSPHP